MTILRAFSRRSGASRRWGGMSRYLVRLPPARRTATQQRPIPTAISSSSCCFAYSYSFCPSRCLATTPHRPARQPADDPDWVSEIDNPPKLVRAGRKHGWGLLILALIPVTAFCLGTWQVQRLRWKTSLLAKLEDRISRPPLPLPPHLDPDVAAGFDYRRVTATGKFRHDREMLLGPRINEGDDGYFVVTPLERQDLAASGQGTGALAPLQAPTGQGTTLLVNRGWIARKFKDQKIRCDEALDEDEVVTVEGLLRQPWKKNIFTPENKPERGEFYFPDVRQMAEIAGATPIWIEETAGKLLQPFSPASAEVLPTCFSSCYLFFFFFSHPMIRCDRTRLLLCTLATIRNQKRRQMLFINPIPFSVKTCPSSGSSYTYV